jgi:hypothetical protein
LGRGDEAADIKIQKPLDMVDKVDKKPEEPTNSVQDVQDVQGSSYFNITGVSGTNFLYPRPFADPPRKKR